MLVRERIVSSLPSAPVTTGAAARSMVEVIRSNTLEATGGRTYSETDPFIDVAGNPTADESLAMKDEQTGRPVQNPDVTLWLQSTTLQTPLAQAYVSSRLADLMVGLGGIFVAAGMGIAGAASRR
jgi:hypothetical protein